MSAAIALREDFSAEDLRALARQSRDTRQCRRLLALAAVAEGSSRAEAAEIGGMDRQTLRDWVHRFNGEGPEGLLDRKTDGPRPKLTSEQRAELAMIVEAGPDRQETGLVRWRRVDLKTVIEDRFGVVYHERSVSRLLHELGFSHLSARPRHPAQKAEVLEDFKKTSRARWPQP
jgi:transposase